MTKDELPDELVRFLKSDRRLTYDVSDCEIGVFAFRSFDEVNEIDLSIRSEDHATFCSMRAWDLVKSCQDYDPRGILVYIPSLRKYGSYDSEREGLIEPDEQGEGDVADDVPMELIEEETEPAILIESCDEEEITFCCQECGFLVTFPSERRGHVETCPECGNYLDVPE